MEPLNITRPSLADFPDLPPGAKLQRQGSHWYVFTIKYSYDKEKKRSRQDREYLGQIVGKDFFTKEEYSCKFTRNGHRRSVPLEKAKPDFRKSEYRKQKKTIGDDSDDKSKNEDIKVKDIKDVSNLSEVKESKTCDDSSINIIPVNDRRSNDFTNVRYYKFGIIGLVIYSMKKTGLIEDLKIAGFFEDTIKVLISLTSFNICKGNNCFYLYEIWSQNRLLPWNEPLNSKQISIFFNSIGVNCQNKIEALFKCRADRVENKEFISIDSTNINCESENVTFRAIGKGKNDNFREQVSFYSLISHKTKQPICYRYFCGNIHDSVTFDDIIKRITPYGNIKGGVVDKGYASLENILLCCKINFLMIFSIKKSKLFQNGISNNYERLLSMNYSDRIPEYDLYGVTEEVEISDSDNNKYKIWRHVFLNVIRREQKISKVQKDLKAFEDAWAAGDCTASENPLLNKYYITPEKGPGECALVLDKNKFFEQVKNFGFFVNISTFSQTAKENIKIYSERDCIEKNFRLSKSDLGNDSIRAHDSNTLMGRGLIYFLSACVCNDLLTSLKIKKICNQKNGKIRYTDPIETRYSLSQILEMAENIGVNRYYDGSLKCTEITKKFAEILDQIGFKNAFSQSEISCFQR